MSSWSDEAKECVGGATIGVGFAAVLTVAFLLLRKVAIWLW